MIRFIYSFLVVLFFIPSHSSASEAWQAELALYIVGAETVSPHVIVGGKLKDGAARQLKHHNVGLVVDTRTAYEGTDEERTIIEAEGITYLNIPMSGLVTPEMVSTFSEAMKKHRDQRVVLHCRSGGRAGELWKAYQETQQ